MPQLQEPDEVQPKGEFSFWKVQEMRVLRKKLLCEKQHHRADLGWFFEDI
jgi:hypothetical protein